MHSAYELDRAIGFWLHLAFNKLRAESLRHFRAGGFDVTPEAWALLVRLWQREGRTQTELAESTFRDKAAVTRMIDAMEAKGLVARQPDPDDRRQNRIALTARGRSLEAELVPYVREWVGAVTAGIDPADLEVARRVLQQIYTNLQD